jgi:5,10-methylenetetrahydromethanopterin reductase
LQKAALILGATSGAPMSQILRIASIAERTGVHGIWMGEDMARGGDVFVQASVMMLNAPTKKIGIGVTSPMVRNISTIARAAAALSEIDPARFRLGLGVGGLQDLARLGLTVEKPVSMLNDAVEALRRIWARETLTLTGENFHLRQFLARYRPGLSIPIYLGVRGPRLLRLAARIADGVILSGPIAYLEKALEMVRAEAAGRDSRCKFRTVIWLPTVVVRKRADKELAKVVAATVIADTPPNVLEMAEMSKDAVESVRRTARERSYAAASKHVTEELLDSFTISGDAKHVSLVFESLATLGAHEIVFGPPYGTPLVRSIREVVRAWERL